MDDTASDDAAADDTTAGTEWAAALGIPRSVEVAPGVVLRAPTLDDCDELVATVNGDLDHLRPWMPWAQEPATPESQEEFLRATERDRAEGRDFVYLIVSDGRIVGAAGLHARRGPGVLEIGYWLRSDAQGQGLVTAAARTLTELAATYAEIDTIAICCDEANERSAAVPRRLGFQLTAVEERVPMAASETGWHQIWTLDAQTVRDTWR